MLIVETIAKVRLRKVLRSGETSFAYARGKQPYPKLGPYLEELRGLLAENEDRSRRERVTMLRLFEDLGQSGYSGGYDAVRRYARQSRSALLRAKPINLTGLTRSWSLAA